MNRFPFADRTRETIHHRGTEDTEGTEELETLSPPAAIFWRAKFNVTRIGHGGSDPGLQTEMLASLSKDIGVILFSDIGTSPVEPAGLHVVSTEAVSKLLDRRRLAG